MQYPSDICSTVLQKDILASDHSSAFVASPQVRDRFQNKLRNAAKYDEDLGTLLLNTSIQMGQHLVTEFRV